MTLINKEQRKAYYAERYLRKKALKPVRVLKSKYRYINDGNKSSILVHKAIAQKVLGRPIPKGVEVHHVDGNGHNNAHTNLVICPNHAYHALLHLRTKALDECGNASWIQCRICRKWDNPENLKLYTPKDQVTPQAKHSACITEYRRNRRIANARCA